jgi:hypothetical protein
MDAQPLYQNFTAIKPKTYTLRGDQANVLEKLIQAGSMLAEYNQQNLAADPAARVLYKHWTDTLDELSFAIWFQNQT